MIALNLRPEVRESYTDQVVNTAVAQASGKAASTAIATVEAAARLWEGAFSSGVSSVLAPWQLAVIGRSLLLTGQSVWWRSRAKGFYAAADVDVRGDSPSPGSWTYRLALPAPAATITKLATADRVLHVRIGATERRPWIGRSPLASSSASRKVLENVERSLDHEHRSPNGHLLAVPDPEGSKDVAAEIDGLAGRAMLVEASDTGLVGEGQNGRSNWQPHRLGPEPAAGTLTARDSVERSILAAAGVPVELVVPANGTDAREALRRFLFITIAPCAALVSGELSRMGLDAEIDFSGLNATDLAGRARAFGTLVTAGVAEAEAKKLTGLD